MPASAQGGRELRRRGGGREYRGSGQATRTNLAEWREAVVDILDVCHGCMVAVAEARLEHARVAASAVFEALTQVLKQLGQHRRLLHEREYVCG